MATKHWQDPRPDRNWGREGAHIHNIGDVGALTQRHPHALQLCVLMSNTNLPLPTVAGLCRACCSPLPLATAIRCKECGSLQDWRRHIFDWTGVAAAFLSIVPLWGVAAAALKFAFESDVPEAAVAASCSKANVKLIVANHGEKSLALQSATTVATFDGVEHATLGRLTLVPKDLKATLVKPGEQQLIDLDVTASGAVAQLPERQSSRNCQVTITAQLRGAKNNVGVEQATCACPV
jgi:hypothetical protein